MSTVTFTSSPSKSRRGPATADAVIAAAVDVARDAAVSAAGRAEVGEYEGVRAEGHRVATHFFASTSPGYRGWRWAVTLARAPRSKTATVCEVSMLAGEGAILAPAWLPWSERLQPGDLAREDVLPYSPDDSRLMPGYSATGDGEADRLALYELGLGRRRVLSPEGRRQAATRWYSGVHGPVRTSGTLRVAAKERRGQVAAQCSTCGFLMLMAGSMRTAFGVCGNEWSPDDGQVVSMDHVCGAHSETDVFDNRRDWPENAPVVDDAALEVFQHGPPPDTDAGPSSDEVLDESVPDDEPAASPEEVLDESVPDDEPAASPEEVVDESVPDQDGPPPEEP